MKKKKIDERIFKKNKEELEQWMIFRHRGSRIENKKGKGSYKRKPKYKNSSYEEQYCGV